MAISASVPVNVASASSVAPFYTVDFHQYSNMSQVFADGGPNKTFSQPVAVNQQSNTGNAATGEWQGPAFISLVNGVGPAASSSSTFMRFSYPAQPTGFCGEINTITVNLRLDTKPTEIWWEVYNRFSTNWVTGSQLAGCGPSPSIGFKHLFTRPEGEATSRSNYQLFMDAGGLTMAGFPHAGFINIGGTNYGTEQGPHVSPPVSTTYADGNWNRWQMHDKVGNNGKCAWGRNGTLIYNWAPISHYSGTDFYGVSFGRTLNQQGIHTGLTIDWALFNFYTSDPGWGW